MGDEIVTRNLCTIEMKFQGKWAHADAHLSGLGSVAVSGLQIQAAGTTPDKLTALLDKRSRQKVAKQEAIANQEALSLSTTMKGKFYLYFL